MIYLCLLYIEQVLRSTARESAISFIEALLATAVGKTSLSELSSFKQTMPAPDKAVPLRSARKVNT